MELILGRALKGNKAEAVTDEITEAIAQMVSPRDRERVLGEIQSLAIANLNSRAIGIITRIGDAKAVRPLVALIAAGARTNRLMSGDAGTIESACHAAVAILERSARRVAQDDLAAVLHLPDQINYYYHNDDGFMTTAAFHLEELKQIARRELDRRSREGNDRTS